MDNFCPCLFYVKKILPVSSDFRPITADTYLLKMFPVEIMLNFENYFRTLQLGF